MVVYIHSSCKVGHFVVRLQSIRKQKVTKETGEKKKKLKETVISVKPKAITSVTTGESSTGQVGKE